MKRYYHKLFNGGAAEKNLERAVASVVNLALNSNKQQHIDSI